eukprot:Skav206568  [mRNA]  locus=scaffold925:166687:175199:- [translate_table: standard]
MTSELPGSTVWVQLPDPSATGAQLESCAEALEQGQQKFEHLQAALVAIQRRMEAGVAWQAESPSKRCRTKGPDAVTRTRFGFLDGSSVEGSWSQTREEIKRLHHKSDLNAAVEVLNDIFHIFDLLSNQLARLFEELTCLESDVSCFHPQLLAIAEIQAEAMGWKLLLLEVTEIPPGFEKFLDAVLAVGDQLVSSVRTLQKRRQALVWDLQTAIEIQSAKSVCVA